MRPARLATTFLYGQYAPADGGVALGAEVVAEVAGAEIVGLIPRAALDRNAAYFGRLERFHEAMVLETLLEERENSRK